MGYIKVEQEHVRMQDMNGERVQHMNGAKVQHMNGPKALCPVSTPLEGSSSPSGGRFLGGGRQPTRA